MPDDSRRLAAGGLQDTREVFVQDSLGVLVRRAREKGQRVGGKLGSTSHDLCIFSLLFLVKTTRQTQSSAEERKVTYNSLVQ